MIDIEQRITAAIERITSGNAPMRVPADETDPDLVLAYCLAEIRRLRAALAARQPVFMQGCDELRARTEGERAAYMEGLEEGKKIAARQPVGVPSAWMDPDGSRVLTAKAKANASGAYKSATSGYTVPLYPPAQAVDLGQFRDLIGFAILHAINLPETDPRRDFIRQANEFMALIASQAVGK
ncbi:TPA: hypothetical protein QDZ72_002473 [Stenotrophomonas maltophilia]|nr:hypothetical protein [Stenotrophomonas maltophilia]